MRTLKYTFRQDGEFFLGYLNDEARSDQDRRSGRLCAGATRWKT